MCVLSSEARRQLLEKGFVELDENSGEWELAAGSSYFIIRNQSALVAFSGKLSKRSEGRGVQWRQLAMS